MGQVYLCQDTVLDRRVAIKFIGTASVDQAARDRFRQEARAIARLSHPNVVTIYRAGEVGGRPYLVSEYVAGRSLDQLDLPIPWPEALRIGVGLARGLTAAHRAGVLHRDIKPANAMLTEGGEVKLLDFGLAKLIDSLPPEARPASSSVVLTETAPAPASPSLTMPGAIVGTPAYMAPEAWTGAGPTPCMDLYSLGAVLYELASGHRPHEGSSVRELRRIVQEHDPQPLSERVADMDRRFSAVVDRCLRRLPEERFGSAAELCAALEELAGVPPPVPARPHRRLRWGVPAALAATGLGVAGWRLLHRPPEMIYVPGGSFVMGSTAPQIDSAFTWCNKLAEVDGVPCLRAVFEREQPARTVQVSPFYLDTTEVTFAQFARWLNQLRGLRVEVQGTDPWVMLGPTRLANLYPSYYPSYGLVQQADRFAAVPEFADRPVTKITWDAARLYCQAQGKRLPTEAEWEFAARGPQGHRFPWGNEEPRCDGVVFGRRKNQGCDHLPVQPPPVGSSAQDRTPLGVRDLGGSVMEWIADRYEERYRPCDPPCADPLVADDTGPSQRVVRGGSYPLPAPMLRSTRRVPMQQDLGGKDIGFRCARSARRK